ncbi:MAG: hypothetical protein E6K94_05500 [Thaumarchaeota archaeon]|nr:MAG: hypothetical protein E6K94_05500 [Nitrososphaerota archaeon]
MKADLHDMYYQDQKQGIIEVFVTLRLPVNLYEAGAGLYRVANYKSFDDYVSDCVVSDLEQLSQGEIADDIVIKKLSVKKQTHCKKCGEWLEGDTVCSECGEISK